MSCTSACRSAKQETGLAVQLPRMGLEHPLSTSSTWAPEKCEQFCTVLMKFLIYVSPKLNCKHAACPSYQMTWNSARSSAITAGSLTMRGTPAWLLNQSQQQEPSTHSLPHWAAAPLPLHGTASKCLVFFEFCTLTPSATHLFFICIVKKIFQRPGTSKRWKIMKHPSQGIKMKVRLDLVGFLSFYLGCYINNTQHQQIYFFLQ